MTETEISKFEVDLDNERVFVDNRWLDRGELATMLTERLASMDYNVGKLSSAIEFLDSTLKTLESFTVRLTPDVAAHLPYRRPFVKYTPTWPRSCTTPPPDPTSRSARSSASR